MGLTDNQIVQDEASFGETTPTIVDIEAFADDPDLECVVEIYQ